MAPAVNPTWPRQHRRHDRGGLLEGVSLVSSAQLHEGRCKGVLKSCRRWHITWPPTPAPRSSKPLARRAMVDEYFTVRPVASGHRLSVLAPKWHPAPYGHEHGRRSGRIGNLRWVGSINGGARRVHLFNPNRLQTPTRHSSQALQHLQGVHRGVDARPSTWYVARLLRLGVAKVGRSPFPKSSQLRPSWPLLHRACRTGRSLPRPMRIGHRHEPHRWSIQHRRGWETRCASLRCQRICP